MVSSSEETTAPKEDQPTMVNSSEETTIPKEDRSETPNRGEEETASEEGFDRDVKVFNAPSADMNVIGEFELRSG
jgi:hypothetical protein